MLKRSLLFLLLCSIIGVAEAQTTSVDSVYSQYMDFNLARFQGEQDKAIELGENLIPLAGKLPEKARISFYFSIGKMYEDNDEQNRSTPYYLKVVAAVPDYYVVNRALGYIYLDSAKLLGTRLNGTQTDNAANQKYFAAYKAAALKALPYLEKAQACDPSDETLAIIKTLYQNIKDTNGLSILNSRLKALSSNCIDILTDN